MRLFNKMKKIMAKIAEHTHLANLASLKLNLILRQLRDCQSCEEDNESEEENVLSAEFYVDDDDVEDSDYDDDEVNDDDCID